MNNFWTLLKYEFIKIFKKKSSVIATLIFLFLAAYSTTSLLTSSVGNETYYSMIDTEKAIALNMHGRLIDTALVSEAVEAYKKVPIDSAVDSYDTEEYREYARPYSPIIGTIAPFFYPSGWGSINEVINTPTEDINDIYGVRNEMMQKRLKQFKTPEAETEYLLNQNAKIETPFSYEYTQGYAVFLGNIFMLSTCAFFLIAFLVSPIFSGEYGKTDDIILSSRNGKKSLIYAKICTGLIGTALILGVAYLIGYIVSVAVFGFNGLNAPIQLALANSPYPLTVKDVMFWSILVTLCIALYHTVFNMLLSAKINSTFLTLGAMLLLGFGTQFFRQSADAGLFYKLSLLVPGKQLTSHQLVDSFCFKLGDVILPPYVFIPVFAIAMTLILLPFVYKGFKNHQVC